eukprot:FR738038.1.p1 GENE.FR738038.1~~FR738038.1.p1  ORF type:complete len:232 (+),score=30.44 FR738038.1:38-697(+)
MESLGLNPEDLNPHGPMESKRALARAQSAQIMSKKFMQRDRVKQQLQRERERERNKVMDAKYKKASRWKHKMSNSPFMVNLVAETERIDEEHHIRLQEESRRQQEIVTRQHAAKQEIILRALQEESDLEALRREKRAIGEEERRLRALLDLEKTNGHRKADRLAAQRAEKQRHQTEREYRRKENMSVMADLQQREKDALREKHRVPLPSMSTFEDEGNW